MNESEKNKNEDKDAAITIVTIMTVTLNRKQLLKLRELNIYILINIAFFIDICENTFIIMTEVDNEFALSETN